MAYDEKLAAKVRNHLSAIPRLKLAEKKMFSGTCFMVNDKMCINVSHDNLMCRFDPEQYETISKRKGFEKMIMRGKEIKGYCYVTPDGFKTKKDLAYWIDRCLDFNSKARSSKKK